MLILSGVTFVVGAALSAGAEHISMVVLGRLVLGLGVGGGTTVRAQPRPAGGHAPDFHHALLSWDWHGVAVGGEHGWLECLVTGLGGWQQRLRATGSAPIDSRQPVASWLATVFCM